MHQPETQFADIEFTGDFQIRDNDRDVIDTVEDHFPAFPFLVLGGGPFTFRVLAKCHIPFEKRVPCQLTDNAGFL
jgi:hypothetical protein